MSMDLKKNHLSINFLIYAKIQTSVKFSKNQLSLTVSMATDFHEIILIINILISEIKKKYGKFRQNQSSVTFWFSWQPV